jgi:hypothetical protein
MNFAEAVTKYSEDDKTKTGGGGCPQSREFQT